jgi:hypothetical protein
VAILVYFPRFGLLCQEKSGNPDSDKLEFHNLKIWQTFHNLKIWQTFKPPFLWDKLFVGQTFCGTNFLWDKLLLGQTFVGTNFCANTPYRTNCIRTKGAAPTLLLLTAPKLHRVVRARARAHQDLFRLRRLFRQNLKEKARLDWSLTLDKKTIVLFEDTAMRMWRQRPLHVQGDACHLRDLRYQFKPRQSLSLKKHSMAFNIV